MDVSSVLKLSLFGCLGGVIAWIAVPRVDVRSERTEEKAVEVDGLVLSAGELREGALSRARAFLEERVAIRVAGKERFFTRAELGAEVDGNRLEKIITDAKNPTSALALATVNARTIRIALPVSVQSERALFRILQIKDEVDSPATDAKLDIESRKVASDQSGVRMDAYATLAKVVEAITLRKPQADAVVEPVPASLTAEQLKDVVFEDVLGYFETKYARDLKHEARTFNLRRAASKLNGFVLMPGQVFDFNAVVGARNEANGYRVAPVIAQGELVDGIGGGTCQISGTLHAASFFAGLDVVERKPHTRPSFYIKMGLDAAVAYPAVTLKLRNPFSFPVVFRETVTEGIVRAEILGPRRSRGVTFIRKVQEVVPFAEREIPDSDIPKGARQLKQRGIPGFKVARYRILRDGSFATRERTVDYYPPTAQLWQVGTGTPDPKFKANDDPHPEYVADEYLTITQAPDVRSPKGPPNERGGGTVESRVPGRYGSYGWTVREGFAKELAGTGNTPSSAASDAEQKASVD